VGKGILQLSQFTIDPALAAAMLGEMGLKKRYRKHLGTAFFTHRAAQVSFFDGNNFRANLGYWIHPRPPAMPGLDSKAHASAFDA
jgi:hypothetical protein